MSVFFDSINGLIVSFFERLPNIFVGIVFFLGFLVIARYSKGIVRNIVERSSRINSLLADLLGKTASALLILIGLLVSAVVVFPSFKPADMIAGLGLSSVAIGFAFKDILQNWLAGILILWRRPFGIGDQIHVKGYEGTVEDINLRSTYIKTYDGERIIIPNSAVYSEAVLVRTAFPKRRVKIMVGIGYTDDIEQGRRIIDNVLQEIDGVSQDPGPWIYVTELAPSSVNFTVFFWTESHQANILKVSDQVITAIKYALDSAGIEMPFPHTVVLLQDAEAENDNITPNSQSKLNVK